MEKQEKTHIVLLGLDHRLLWQLTRTLADFEDRIVIDCVKEPSAAREICDREPVDVIVVDGWDQAWRAARYLSGDEVFEGGEWKWIILADSLPLECLPSGRPSPSAVFYEKPFNPKEFPTFLLEVVESREAPVEQEGGEPVSEEIPLPLTPGESYRAPAVTDAAETETEERVEEPTGVETGHAEPEPVARPDEPDAFHRLVDEGFARLGDKDWQGAEAHWSEALKIRPNDPRLLANLKRLERLMKEA